MHVLTLFHTFFQKTFCFVHAHRLQSLLTTVESLLNGAHLSLTSLGRHLTGQAKVKHKIKRVDRLLGNPHLYQERLMLYQAMAHRLMAGLSKAVIIIDWSPYRESNYHMLKASLAAQGRSITLYEEVHTSKQQQKHRVHKEFVARLKQILPAHLHIIVVTDAGFTNKWFKLLVKQGWEFVGRIPGHFKYRLVGTSHWLRINQMLPKRYTEPTFLGEVELTQSNPLICQIVLYKARLKRRKKQATRLRPLMLMMEKKYSAHHRSAWMLASSLKVPARCIVNYYQLRMQIEQNFRDIKNSHWGLGLYYCQTTSKKRMEIFLLIAAIALFMLWLVGWLAEQQKWHYSYQVNTLKRRVLSLIYLGQQVIYHSPNSISHALWTNNFQALPDFLAAIYTT